jgi:hypothetical protein
MIVSTRLAKFLGALPELEVEFGCGGIRIYPAAELNCAQVGYSVSASSESLCGTVEGAWRAMWIVIGEDTGIGDPIFVDSADPNLPVFTAMTGEGSWDPKPVAPSIEAFGEIFREFEKIASSRSNPVEADDNPIPDSERDAFLSRVREINADDSGKDFWEALFGYISD